MSPFLFAAFSGLFLGSVRVGRSSAVACHDSGMLLSTFYTRGDESVRGEVGFNTTFVLLARENGTIVIRYPWMNATEFETEMNFTELQREPLRNLSLVTNSSRVGVHYSCNLTTIECAVNCSFGSNETGLGAADRNVGGFCVEGFGLEMLKNSSNITERWLRLCDDLIAVQNRDASPVYMDLTSDGQKLFCRLNTTVPIRYNVTMWDGGVNATSAPCRRDRNLTVICELEVNVTGVRNITDVLCTIRSEWWPDRFTEYRFDEDYYEYYDEDEDEGVLEARSGDEPTADASRSNLGGAFVVAACVGLSVGFVGMLLRRRNIWESDPSVSLEMSGREGDGSNLGRDERLAPIRPSPRGLFVSPDFDSGRSLLGFRLLWRQNLSEYRL